MTVPARPDGRSSASRRLGKLIRALSDECGGETNLTTAERELVRAAALAVTRVRSLQDQIVRGEVDVDDELVCRLLNSATRTLSTVAGKSRKRTQRQPSLAEYLKGGAKT